MGRHSLDGPSSLPSHLDHRDIMRLNMRQSIVRLTAVILVVKTKIPRAMVRRPPEGPSGTMSMVMGSRSSFFDHFLLYQIEAFVNESFFNDGDGHRKNQGHLGETMGMR
ncbi:hypothetical protein HAX54_049986 [Datura stramonium]|uniref:Uncharacterized protein n=1 Tax=Datura stramonium TaxID=4076 RepID=A0ABS8WPV5_DATST|nr:hypothetical protein [Datura stramonium]